MRISDWSSDVCSSDLRKPVVSETDTGHEQEVGRAFGQVMRVALAMASQLAQHRARLRQQHQQELERAAREQQGVIDAREQQLRTAARDRSEERRVGKEGVSTCRSRWSTYH